MKLEDIDIQTLANEMRTVLANANASATITVLDDNTLFFSGLAEPNTVQAFVYLSPSILRVNQVNDDYDDEITRDLVNFDVQSFIEDHVENTSFNGSINFNYVLANALCMDNHRKREPESPHELKMTEFWFKFTSTMHFNLIEMIKSKSIRHIGKFSSLTYSNENEEWRFTPHPQKGKVVCVNFKDITNNLTGTFDIDFNNEDGITFDLIEGMSGGEFRNATLKREMCNALLNFSSIESESSL